MIKKVRIAVATVVIGGFSAAAAQAQEMTLGFGTPSLVGRVSITEPVTVSCSGFDPSLVVFVESVNVSVQQASGRAIAHGSATGFASPIFPCDGSQNTIDVVIPADPSGPPFHGGSAVFTASGGAQAGTPCFGGFCGPFEGASASAGPARLKLR